MKSIILVLLVSTITFSLQAQSTDYNTKKGVAIQGYDVVAYFNNSPQEGSSEFAHQYGGVTYKFISKENLDLFKQNPEKYLPEYGGYCAYAIANKGKKVDIDTKTFEIRDGKLYLFYNSWGNNTLKKWLEENPDTLIQDANKNWDKLK